jgi:hypothetical protein
VGGIFQVQALVKNLSFVVRAMRSDTKKSDSTETDNVKLLRLGSWFVFAIVVFTFRVDINQRFPNFMAHGIFFFKIFAEAKCHFSHKLHGIFSLSCVA